MEVGGPDRDRTDDLLDANQALSQLSYGPLLNGIPTCRTPLILPKHTQNKDFQRRVSVFESRIDPGPLDPSNGSVDHTLLS